MINNMLSDFFSSFKKDGNQEYEDRYEYENEYEYEQDGYQNEMNPYEEEREEIKPRFLQQRTQREARVVDPNSVRMQIYKPTQYEDANEIIQLLKNRESVVMNLEYITKDDGRRIIDTVNGGVTALDGHIVKVTNTIFIAAPKNYTIEGEMDKRRKSTFNFR